MLPRPDEDRARTQNESERAAQIAELLRLSALRPPKPDEIITSAESRRAVETLLRDGVLVRAVDRAKRKQMLFHRDAIDSARRRSEEHTSELQSLMRSSYAVFCLKKK